MDHVIQSYEQYREEDRLTTRNAGRVEFLTSVRILNAHLPAGGKMLDCAAGTGVYAFHYAGLGFDVTALDITPRHVEFMQQKLQGSALPLRAALNDAIDLSSYSDGEFDAVLCMGPLYHLTDEADRRRCLAECLRVLKPGGMLAVGYISRFSTFPYVALIDRKLLNLNLAQNLLESGALSHTDPNCFWTDTYYHTPEGIEQEIRAVGGIVLDHAGVDWLSLFMREKVNNLTEEELAVWCEYHYRVCREKSLLGASSHGLVIAKK